MTYLNSRTLKGCTRCYYQQSKKNKKCNNCGCYTFHPVEGNEPRLTKSEKENEEAFVLYSLEYDDNFMG